MIPPLVNPPERKTAHGATCSPRLSRLYTWLNANGVALSDFSTDEGVQRYLPQLRKLQGELEQLRDATPVLYLDHLLADLGNLMRRTPAARVPVAARRG